jgi:hypothetical protein
MPPKKRLNARLYRHGCRGFILLEVLVAMSMILGVWMASVGAYQRLALNLNQQESKRSQLRKDSDVFEIQEQSRTHFKLPSPTVIHEPARMSSRDRSVRTTTQSIIKNKR